MVELQEVQRMIELLTAIPAPWAYAIIGLGSAVENIFPPIPSDTFVVLGGILADQGTLVPGTVLFVSWAANVLGALAVYGLARRYGPAFFLQGWGRRLLRPHQFDRVSEFYARYGLWAIFLSRFLPVLRVVIPTFAGFAHLGFFRTAIPVAAASLLWYGIMLYAGIFASRNVGRILGLVGRANAWLLVVAALFIVLIAVWWVRSRRDPDHPLRRFRSERERREEGGDPLAGADATPGDGSEAAGDARGTEPPGP